MKKFYAFFVAVLVAVTAFAQSPKAHRAMAMPTRIAAMKAPVVRTLIPHSLPVSMKKRHVVQPKTKVARRTTETAASYVRVSSVPETWEGEYLIVYENGSLAMNGALTQKLDAAGNTVAVTIADQEIACTEETEAISFTIAAVEGGYSIQSRSGLYMGWNSTDKNGLDSNNKTAFVNTLGIDGDGNADIVAECGSYLRYNASQGQERFRYFKAATYTNQEPVALYKKGGEKTEIVKPELVVLPEGLETEPYTMAATVYTADDEEELNKTVQVAFDGSTIYVQGLSYWFEDAWAKGTISGNKVLFASNQFMGEDEYGPDYLIGYVMIDEENFEAVENIVFDYDPETRVLTLNEDNFIGEAGEVNDLGIWNYCDDMTLTPGEAIEPEEPEVVELPEGLAAESYVLTAQELDYDENYTEVYNTINVPAHVAFDKETGEVYVQGLCSWLPDAWVKGTFNESEIVLPTGQFFGIYESLFGDYPLYFVGTDDAFEEPCDVKFSINNDGKLLTTTQWVLSSVNQNVEDAFTAWAAATLIKAEDKAATPAAPTIIDYDDWDEQSEYGYVEFILSMLDEKGEPMIAEKLSYKVYVDEGGKISEYKFTADLYEYLDEDMTEIPFLYSDDWDFMRDGTDVFVCFNSPTQSYDRIGVQSIYRGGNAENKSEITWYTIQRGDNYEAVKTVVTTGAENGAIYNLAGQRVQKATKGLYIQNGKKILVK